jgi:uncharacterized damage-inducible protein DinB
MPPRQPLDVTRELLESFEHGMLATEYLVRVLPAPVWRAKPPAGEGRTIAAIVAHIQSVRRTFAKMGDARPVPPGLDRLQSTQAEAVRALEHSRQALVSLFTGALGAGQSRVKGMPRRAVNMMVYLVEHDAHHRGQITSLARTLDHRLASEDVMRIWGWKKIT